MNKRNLIIGGSVVIIAIFAIGLFFVQQNGAEQVIRRTIINNQEQAAGAHLQRCGAVRGHA